MYNRYAAQDADYTPVEPQNGSDSKKEKERSPFSSLRDLLGKAKGDSLSGLLKTFHLDTLDKSDVLLLLILLLLFWESEDDELLITLGLFLLLAFADHPSGE